MIAIRDLRFTHPGGAFTLDIPALTVEKGARVAVVGPSGTGKTTFLNLLSGIIVPGQGSVALGQTHVSALPDVERRALRISRIGFVFQNFALVDYLSAVDNVLYPYRITDRLMLDDTIRERARTLLQAVGLGGKAGRKPAALSQGEQQRVAICRALITNPELVLADEATGNLDPANKTLILDLLFEQVAAHHATLIAVTHDHDLLDRFDKVIDFADLRTLAA